MVGDEFAASYLQMERNWRDIDRLQREADAARSVVLDARNVWTLKTWNSPAAGGDRDIRLQAMELMGLRAQILFPVAFTASVLVQNRLGSTAAVRHYNDYVREFARGHEDRLKPVAMLPMHDVDFALAEARRVIDAGLRIVNVPCHAAPGGVSPADKAWDPLWSLLEEADVPVTLHVGGGGGFVPREFGALTDGSLGEGVNTREISGPYGIITSALAPQAWLSSLILGGGLEKHPRLRVGVLEFTATWVGGWARQMDDLVLHLYRRRGALGRLSLLPSEYVARNVRVSCMWWEDVRRYIDAFGLEDVYCFSSDFPHGEGGTDPIGSFHRNLSPLGDAMLEKFFVRNCEWIMPS
jgi:predicted TIM-barrel fold metal-dependent hydrolase